jgi:hypothetical protein
MMVRLLLLVLVVFLWQTPLSIADIGVDDSVAKFTPKQDCVCRGEVICKPKDLCTCLVKSNVLSSCRCGFSDADKFETNLCVQTECCDGYDDEEVQHRRHLKGADFEVDHDNPHHQQLYQMYLETCGGYEYDVYLYVTSHLYAVLSPSSPDAIEAKCPFLVTHAHFESSDGVAIKKLLFWESQEKGNARFAGGNWEEKAMFVGSFSLLELARAYESVDLDSDGPYDIVSNNCGNYIIRVGLQVGIRIDSQMISFVTQRLIEQSSAKFLDGIKAGVNSFWVFVKDWIQYYLGFLWGAKLANQTDQGALVKMFVTNQASRFQ